MIFSTIRRCGRSHKDKASTLLPLRDKSMVFSEDNKLKRFSIPLYPLIDLANK